MGRVLVTYAGRSPALNFCRSLRISGEDFFILGVDDNKFSVNWAEADEKLLVPPSSHPDYLKIINHLIDKYKIEFLYASKSNDELLLFSENREKLNAKVFFPSKEDVLLFENKWETYKHLTEKDICSVPITFLIHNEDELKSKMDELSDNGSKEIWIRRIYGSGGAGSIATSDYQLAKAWIDRNDGWGKFSISEKLTDKTLTWSAIWNNGELVASQIRERLYWEFADRAPSGVTGVTGAQKLVFDASIDELSLKIVRSMTESPNGVIGIDFTRDSSGKPFLTEIQASRLYTSTYFMSKCGVNFPYMLYKLAMGKTIAPEEKNCNADDSLVWLKYVENFPCLITQEEIDAKEKDMEKFLEEISNG